MRLTEGPALFKAAVETMARCATQALAQADLPVSAIDRFIPHQANGRVFEPLCRKLGLDPVRTVRIVREYGNASAATIPLALSLSHHATPFRAGETVLLTAAGAGLTGGAAVLRVS
jgi:3-oxoacyl-[acyl-carrier-protein] synthase-3